jgi:hypothetical protein
MTALVAALTVSRPELADHMAKQPPPLLACPPKAIRRFLDGLRDRYGSTDAYLHAIGVDRGTRAAMRGAAGALT